MMTRTTNSHHCHHKNDGRGTWPGKGRDNRGSRGSRRVTPWYVSFILLIFHLLNVYMYLELPWWRQMATTSTSLHLHLQNRCRLEMQMRLEFWYVKNFFFALLNNHLLLDCMYRTVTRMTMANGHHLWDDEWGLKTHLHLESLVTGVMTSNDYRIINSQSQRIVCSEVKWAFKEC